MPSAHPLLAMYNSSTGLILAFTSSSLGSANGKRWKSRSAASLSTFQTVGLRVLSPPICRFLPFSLGYSCPGLVHTSQCGLVAILRSSKGTFATEVSRSFRADLRNTRCGITGYIEYITYLLELIRGYVGTYLPQLFRPLIAVKFPPFFEGLWSGARSVSGSCIFPQHGKTAA